ncbi:MAG: fluoride efflux transporter CrcB [Planctomycetota bacterium]|nr:MAG: fluoride efflux transporter CrcB [Planctomycetota bacterium]
MDGGRTGLVKALLVGAGGFAGAVGRWALAGLAHRLAPLTTFPVGTLAVNLLGCLAIGVVAGLAESRQLFGPEARLFLLVGLLGGFTTFSTFGNETFAMLRDGEGLRAAANVGVHLVAGLALVWLGHFLTASR